MRVAILGLLCGLLPAAVFAQPTTRTLVFDDEFQATSIDWLKWYPTFRNKPNSGGACMSQNLDYETPPAAASQYGHASIYVRAAPNGVQCGTPGQYGAGTYRYIGGLLRSAYQPQYGYFELALKMGGRGAQGVDDNFLLYDPSENGLQEIDGVEVKSTKTTDRYYTVHWGNSSQDKTQAQVVIYNGVDTAAGYHTYGLDWEPNFLTWYFDGKQVALITDNRDGTYSVNGVKKVNPYPNVSPIPSAPMEFFILPDTCRGSSGWCHAPAQDSQTYPHGLLVQHVRFYSHY